MRIDSENAFSVLTMLEGESWKKKQLKDLENPFGFFIYQKVWNILVNEGYLGQVTPGEAMSCLFNVKGDGAIYGEAGYARYVVSLEGDLCLLKWSVSSEEKIEKAKQLGVNVI